MYLDERNLVSATELNRNPGRFIAAAADGRRLVVMSNNVPTAAIIGMADLRRLDDLDDQPDHPSVAFDVEPPRLADLASSRLPGTTVVGVDVNGSPVVLPIEGPHVVVGATGSGLSTALSAFIAGATPAATVALEFLVLTENSTVSRHHDVNPATPIAVAADLGTRSEAIRLITLLEDEVGDRTAVLRRLEVNTFAEARNADPSLSPVPDLVIVADQLSRLHPDVCAVLEGLVVRGRELSIYVWVFDQRPRYEVKSFLAQPVHRIALRAISAADSRDLIGNTDAHDDRLPAGGGFLQTADRPATYVRLAGPDHAGGEWPSDSRPSIWVPSLPDHVDFDVVNDMWHSEAGRGDDSRHVVPIGLLDDLSARRHKVFTLDISPGEDAICVYSPDRTLALDAIVSAIAHTSQEAAQIYYLGDAPVRPAEPIVHAVWRNVEQFIASVDARMEAPLTPDTPRAVVVVDDVNRLRRHDFEFHARLMDASGAGVQLVLGAGNWIEASSSHAFRLAVVLELADLYESNSSFRRPHRGQLRRRGTGPSLHARTERGLVLIASPTGPPEPAGLPRSGAEHAHLDLENAALQTQIEDNRSHPGRRRSRPQRRSADTGQGDDAGAH